MTYAVAVNLQVASSKLLGDMPMKPYKNLIKEVVRRIYIDIDTEVSNIFFHFILFPSKSKRPGCYTRSLAK
jgi:hypothetical protein